MITYENKPFYTIFEINDYIKTLFDNTLTLNNVGLIGEVSNFRGANRSGHLYFSLKDEKSMISGVIFKFDYSLIDFDFKNGDDVIVEGNLSTYTASGTYQIIVKKLYSFGKGNLLLQKEKLKEKLNKLGYFDDSHKKELPRFPINIGIITGKNSAASQDFKINLLRRMPILNLVFYECLVQGEKAPEDIVKNLKLADENHLDLIILGRGGGASDDLNAFDDENVVKTIYELKTPLIAAIGHEINRTFSDFAADKYASTPTGAAELAVIDYHELLNNLDMNYQYIFDQVSKKLTNFEMILSKLKANEAFKDINIVFKNKINALEKIKINIVNEINNKIINYQNKVNLSKEILSKTNPKKLLEKGYALILNENNEYVSDIDKVNINENIYIEMKRGQIKAKVEDIKYGK